MSSIVISGDTSGAITLAAPAVAGTNTITLPASTGTVLTTGSPQSGGVIQVVQSTTTTSTATTSTSFVTGVLAASITPKFSTSTILILCSANMSTGGANIQGAVTVYRGATNLMTQGQSLVYSGSNAVLAPVSLMYSDSPATTSSTTYTIYFKNTNNSAGTVTFNSASASGAATAQIILLEIAA
jgi:hypothetical protein